MLHRIKMLESQDSDVQDNRTDKSRCAHLRSQLKICLLDTDCCKVDKLTPRQCIRTRHPSVPQECYALWNTFFECKHSIMDGRRRFRGMKGY